MPPSPGEVPSAAKKSPSELAGKYEMIKDTAGNDKRGLCMAVYPCGFFLCVVCGIADKESMDKCCCPCMIAPFCPIGGGKYMKCSADLCAPFMIVPQEDGTIDGIMQGIYQKKSAGGASPSPDNMSRHPQVSSSYNGSTVRQRQPSPLMPRRPSARPAHPLPQVPPDELL